MESALHRPQQLLHDHPDTTLWQLAATYACAIVEVHAFADANKRTAFVVAATFLEDNGYRIETDQLEIVTAMLALAEHGIELKELADWFERNSVKI